MTDFTMTVTVALPYDEAVARVRDLLGEAGFGVLTEIDLAATLRAKLGVEIAPQMILGACRPQLAHQALQADPRLAAMLPCNVVVASEGEGRSRIDVFDPAVMTLFSDAIAVAEVANDARGRLAGMLAAVGSAAEGAINAA
jgi:uncharacterized protein (DUF302 family)